MCVCVWVSDCVCVRVCVCPSNIEVLLSKVQLDVDNSDVPLWLSNTRLYGCQILDETFQCLFMIVFILCFKSAITGSSLLSLSLTGRWWGDAWLQSSGKGRPSHHPTAGRWRWGLGQIQAGSARTDGKCSWYVIGYFCLSERFVMGAVGCGIRRYDFRNAMLMWSVVKHRLSAKLAFLPLWV